MQAIDQKRLHEYLDAFSVSTGVPVTLFTPDGSILEEFQTEKKFCQFFPIYRQPDSVCGSIMLFSAKSSYHLGEPYIFSCPSGLIHIAVPVVVSEKFCGCAVAGPLSMGPVSAELLTQAFEFNQFFELYISLARMSTERGASLRNIFGLDFKFINSLNELNTLDSLAQWSRELVAHFVDDIFADLPQVSSATTRAVSYINAHYMDKLTLRDLASALFLNESSLSKLFRQELGTSFTDYLNRIRIEHSTELMRNTDRSLLEISGLVGFDDQSYFTKIFKKVTGTTPRQYKSQLNNEKHASD